jgi:hypothetical protein
VYDLLSHHNGEAMCAAAGLRDMSASTALDRLTTFQLKRKDDIQEVCILTVGWSIQDQQLGRCSHQV